MSNTRYEIRGLHVFAPRPCKWARGVLYSVAWCAMAWYVLYVLGNPVGVPGQDLRRRCSGCYSCACSCAATSNSSSSSMRCP